MMVMTRSTYVQTLIERVQRSDADAQRPRDTEEQRDAARRALHEAVADLDEALWRQRYYGETVQQVRERLAPEIWP
jgi:hypothetical protein